MDALRIWLGQYGRNAIEFELESGAIVVEVLEMIKQCNNTKQGMRKFFLGMHSRFVL